MTDRTAIWNEAMEEAARECEKAVTPVPIFSASPQQDYMRTLLPTWNNAARGLAAAIRARKIGEG